MNTYLFRLRPPSIGTHPRKGLQSITSDQIEFNGRVYWGTATYDRELSKQELYDYDLDSMVKQYEVIRKEITTGKIYINIVNEEQLSNIIKYPSTLYELIEYKEV